MLEEAIPECPNCGTGLNKIKGPYGMFWGCKNYKECHFKGFSADKPRPKEKPEVRLPPQSTADQIILEEVQALGQRLDTIEKGFADKMANFKKILVLIDKKIDDNRGKD